CRRVTDCARAAASTSTPEHVGETQFRQPQRRRNPHRIVAIIAVRGNSIQVGRLDSRVLAGAENRFQREPKLADRCLPALVVLGLTETDDRDLVLDCIVTHWTPLHSHSAWGVGLPSATRML